MSDWLDDLLSDLPSDPPPGGLAARVQFRLEAARRRTAWWARARQLLLGGAAALGIWLVLPWLGRLTSGGPPVSFAGVGGWLRSLAASPTEAVVEALSRAVDLEAGIAGGIPPDLAVGLLFVAGPALVLALELLGGASRPEVGFR